MRTDIRLFKIDKFNLASETSHDLPQAVLSEGVDLAGSCSSMDGVTLQHRLDPVWAEKGVIFGSLSELASEHSELIQKHLLNKAVDPHFDRFSALHSAFWSTGVFLYVPKGVVIDKPLHSIAGMSDGGSDLAHTLVILEDGAEATLLS